MTLINIEIARGISREREGEGVSVTLEGWKFRRLEVWRFNIAITWSVSNERGVSVTLVRRFEGSIWGSPGASHVRGSLCYVGCLWNPQLTGGSLFWHQLLLFWLTAQCIVYRLRNYDDKLNCLAIYIICVFDNLYYLFVWQTILFVYLAIYIICVFGNRRFPAPKISNWFKDGFEEKPG